MSTAIAIALGEYLATVYRPDREFIDGELLERNVGEWDHSRLQGLLCGYLLNREKEWGILTVPEQRVQVKSKLLPGGHPCSDRSPHGFGDTAGPPSYMSKSTVGRNRIHPPGSKKSRP